MSINSILHSAISGLSASQAGMQTVSTNIANVGTVGYARQTVSQSASVTGGAVNGVVVGEPSRVADKFLEAAVYQRAGTAGAADATANYLDRLQALLGAPSAESGLSSRLSAISSSISEVTGLQGSPEAVALFTGNIQDSIDTLNGLRGDVANLQGDVDSEVADTVTRANELLKKIHGLNAEVARLQGQGMGTSGPADERMNALQELSGLIAVSVREQPDGRVTIDTGSGQVLLDRRLRQLSYADSGIAGAQSSYSSIDIRFAGDDGVSGASTGTRIESASVGGKLGGLLDMRDRVLPGFSEQLGQVFTGLAQTLNAVSNAGTTLPAPQVLHGQSNGLIGADRLGFTGKATFAVVSAEGTLVAKTTVDFDALGSAATVDDAVAAINAGLGAAGSAGFSNGVLSIGAASSANGIAIAQDSATPSDRAGVGFSQFFGLNNLVRSETSALVPSGFVAGDATGFAAGQTSQVMLRGANGSILASQTLTAATGDTWGDVVNQLNSGDLAAYGTFALDDKGRIAFTPKAGSTGATISVPADNTTRYGTSLSFSALSGLTGAASGLSTAQVSADFLNNTARVPLALLQADAAVGGKAIGSGDIRNANAFVDALLATADFGKDGKATVVQFANRLLGNVGAQASLAQTTADNTSARLTDATTRRDSYSGVNIDEELAHMVVLQNSYSAAARVITTASKMYDALLDMV
ncbi:flagellar hook-associated protein FlgK [Novosphingobium colocasiae]|uniref:Flagellar hook-associated protein 1 n=2 Tax=Bacteria TaxID=2 RepID=A0A918PDN9_9SPHN|nr:flagellar hook-associated protein FlgK [Novosphingobium colocasiae]GGZ00267.1 flagellar hook-associated protein FlgK [Novosphingobium colocasiae]